MIDCAPGSPLVSSKGIRRDWPKPLRSGCALLGRIAAVIIFGSTVSGCLATLQDPDRLYSVQQETDIARQILPTLETQYYQTANESDRQSIRNDIIARRMYVIDTNYSAYEAEFGWQNQGFGFAADTASLGLNTAGTLVPVAATTRLLGGIAGAVTGVKGNYQADLLAAKTGQIIQSQMRANRDQVAAEIIQKMGQPTATYPLSLALTDLENYYRAGTITSGLIKAADIVGTNALIQQNVKATTQILTTTYSADNTTAALLKFIRINGKFDSSKISQLNNLMTDVTFPRAPDGNPWIATQIMYGPDYAAIRLLLLQKAEAAGLIPH
jgi:hypothetical protein